MTVSKMSTPAGQCPVVVGKTCNCFLPTVINDSLDLCSIMVKYATLMIGVISVNHVQVRNWKELRSLEKWH